MLTIIAGVLFAIYLVRQAVHQDPPLPPSIESIAKTEKPVSRKSITPNLPPIKPGTEPMLFNREGLTGRISREVERVTKPSQIALYAHGKSRWVCILVDNDERFYTLEEGWHTENFPILAKGNFKQPPAPILRTMSIYRSLAKTEMDYSRENGDGIIVLLCPKDAWTELNLDWPVKAE